MRLCTADKSVFGGEFIHIGRFGEMSESEEFKVPVTDNNKIIQVGSLKFFDCRPEKIEALSFEKSPYKLKFHGATRFKNNRII